MFPISPENIYLIIAAIAISLTGIAYGLKMMINYMTLDFIFVGQFIRDADNIVKFFNRKK
jgi:hypothetical protein